MLCWCEGVLKGGHLVSDPTHIKHSATKLGAD